MSNVIHTNEYHTNLAIKRLDGLHCVDVIPFFQTDRKRLASSSLQPARHTHARELAVVEMEEGANMADNAETNTDRSIAESTPPERFKIHWLGK